MQREPDTEKNRIDAAQQNLGWGPRILWLLLLKVILQS